MTKYELDQLTYNINAACIEVHKNLGPGLLESVYHECLKIEFDLRKIKYVSEMQIEIDYKGNDILVDFRCDFLIENAIILEIKAVTEMKNIFKAQILTYMKLIEIPKGILLNFNVENIMRDGQQTFVNQIFRSLQEQ